MSRYYKPCKYNADTRQQMWMSVVGDFHDSFCSCWHPFAHLLDIIFPEGHKDKDLTVRQIIERDLQCHSGGDGEESHGMANGDTEKEDMYQKEERESSIKDEEIEELIAAAENTR